MIVPGNFVSRFSGCGQRQAMLVLGVVGITVAYALFVGLMMPDTSPPQEYPPEALEDPLYRDDSHLYRRLIQRVHDGEPYYDAANLELRQHGFQPNSVFNWRLPTYAWFLGSLPRPFHGQIVLIALAVIALALVFAKERKEVGLAGAGITCTLIYGVFHWVMAAPRADLDTVPAVLFQETWAAVLITISVAAHGLGWRMSGVAAGLAALFWRELALPYCVIAATLALWQGKRREAIAWGAGLALFVFFFVSHGVEVTRRLEGNAAGPTNVSFWLGLTGLRFHFYAMNMNSWLNGVPGWAMACYLSLAVIGLTGWKGGVGTLVGLTVAAYLGAFCVIGRPVNVYWGLLYAPLLPFGIVRAPAVLRDLILAARGQKTVVAG